MKHLLTVMIGGAIGSAMRYLLTLIKIPPSNFPIHTLIINLIGCFCIGLLDGFLSKAQLSEATRLFWIGGVLGAFTTFSTFGLDIATLHEQAKTNKLILYITISILGGYLLLTVGQRFSK